MFWKTINLESQYKGMNWEPNSGRNEFESTVIIPKWQHGIETSQGHGEDIKTKILSFIIKTLIRHLCLFWEKKMSDPALPQWQTNCIQ